MYKKTWHCYFPLFSIKSNYREQLLSLNKLRKGKWLTFMYLYVENFVIILTAASVISISALACLYTSGEGYVVKFYIGISIISVCFGALMGGFLGFTKTNHRLNSFESTICGLLVYLVYNEEITQKYR